MHDCFRTYLCPIAAVPAAQDAASQYDGGAGMFTTPCSPTGALPATHSISSGFVTDAIDEALRAVPGMVVSTAEPFTALADAGLTIITAPVE